jgi:hypothetical protein
MEEKEGFEEWNKKLETLDFEKRAEMIKDKILESDELDKVSKRYFSDSFAYVMGLYKSGKPLDTNLMRIHIVDIKGYKEFRMEEFNRVLMMLSLCGFCFNYNGSDMQKTEKK